MFQLFRRLPLWRGVIYPINAILKIAGRVIYAISSVRFNISDFIKTLGPAPPGAPFQPDVPPYMWEGMAHALGACLLNLPMFGLPAALTSSD